MAAITTTDPADRRLPPRHLGGPLAAPAIAQLQALLDRNVHAWALDARAAGGGGSMT